MVILANPLGLSVGKKGLGPEGLIVTTRFVLNEFLYADVYLLNKK